MIAATADVVDAWVRDQVEAGPSGEWPDLMTAEDVMANVARASASGTMGLPPRTRVPSADRIGRLLSEMGAVRLAGGNQVRLKGGRKVRLWAVRRGSVFASLAPGAVSQMYEGNTAADFAGSEVISLEDAAKGK